MSRARKVASTSRLRRRKPGFSLMSVLLAERESSRHGVVTGWEKVWSVLCPRTSYHGCLT